MIRLYTVQYTISAVKISDEHTLLFLVLELEGVQLGFYSVSSLVKVKELEAQILEFGQDQVVLLWETQLD